MKTAPMIVTLLTDYGHDDEFAGVCRGVIARIARGASVIDITHGIPRHDVRRGAIVLRHALPYMPVGVHVAVVDPTVGTPRRAVALRLADDRLLVGPDNGLLMPAAAAAGGVIEVVDISRSPHRLEPVSATFHGRDIFAPVAAHLAAGADLGEAGEHLDPDELTALELPAAVVGADGTVTGHVLGIDRYGNVGLDVSHDQLAGTGLTLGRAVAIEAGGQAVEAPFVAAFGDVDDGELMVYEDAHRTLAVAVNRGNAAEALGLADGAIVRLGAGR